MQFKARYSYLPQQFAEPGEILEELGRLVATGDFTLGKPVGDGEAAMLYLDGGERMGVPNLYLVETEDDRRLRFTNTRTGITHSVIDFYTPQQDDMLADLRSRVLAMNGRSGFYDPDGNSLAVCDAVHRGQVSV